MQPLDDAVGLQALVVRRTLAKGTRRYARFATGGGWPESWWMADRGWYGLTSSPVLKFQSLQITSPEEGWLLRVRSTILRYLEEEAGVNSDALNCQLAAGGPFRLPCIP